MSAASPDFYHQKTDAELQFFVEHPELYEAELRDSAQQELRRRGALALPLAPTAPAAPYVAPVYEAAPARTGLKAAVLGAGLLALGGGIYYLKKSNDDATAAVRARNEAQQHRPPAKLVEEKTSVIPSYDVAGIVAQQLNRVPAAERADATALRQFRELAKRFWAAETQTEYLIAQAHAGQAGPMFSAQAMVVRQTWNTWNQAAVYGYKFGPVMTAQLTRMNQAASNQEHILDQLPDLLPGRVFLKNKEMVSREADVQDLLQGILPVSPVTGKAYKATVLAIKA